MRVDRPDRRVAAEGERGQRERLQPWRSSARSSAACACRTGRRPARPRVRGGAPDRTARRPAKPSATPLSVSLRTSSVWATSVSQLPICEMSWPPKNSRKLRTRGRRNVSRVAFLSRIKTVPSRSGVRARRARRRDVRGSAGSSAARRLASQASLRSRISPQQRFAGRGGRDRQTGGRRHRSVW